MAPSYGTVSGDRHNQNGLLDDAEQERAALLEESSNKQGIYARIEKHMTAEISKSWADLALLACYVITGLLDSSSVQVWGSFVSMQTGEMDSHSPDQTVVTTNAKRQETLSISVSG